MAQHRTSIRRINQVVILATASVASLLAAGTLGAQRSARAASSAAATSPVAAAKPVADETVLITALDAELQRAMSSLGADGAAAAQQPKPTSSAMRWTMRRR